MKNSIKATAIKGRGYFYALLRFDGRNWNFRRCSLRPILWPSTVYEFSAYPCDLASIHNRPSMCNGIEAVNLICRIITYIYIITRIQRCKDRYCRFLISWRSFRLLIYGYYKIIRFFIITTINAFICSASPVERAFLFGSFFSGTLNASNTSMTLLSAIFSKKKSSSVF